MATTQVRFFYQENEEPEIRIIPIPTVGDGQSVCLEVGYNLSLHFNSLEDLVGWETSIRHAVQAFCHDQIVNES